MAALQCHKTTEKGLSQGYYGGSSFGQKASDMASWAFNASKRENKYQGTQNGYAMAYSESECHGQIRRPNHGMSETQTVHGMAEFQSEYGHHKSQNSTVKSKAQFHGHGNGFGGHSSNGMSQIQRFNNHASPAGKHQNHGYGYGHESNHGKYGHGFSNQTNYEKTEAHAYAYDEFETNGYGNYKHSGPGNGFLKTQAAHHHPGKNMGYETKSETSLYRNTETKYSGNGHYNGGGRGYHAGNGADCHGMTKNMGDQSVRGLLRKMKTSISGNRSCSDDDDSESDNDECGRKVWISKAL